MRQISLQGSQELMSHKYTALILATGGTPMVRAAHSTGKPAYGVGPGNVPVYVDRSADVEKAARYIVASKAFDCSTICATEQAVMADAPIAERLMMINEAGRCIFYQPKKNPSDCARYSSTPDGAMNTATVGKPAIYLAAMAGISVPKRYARVGLPVEQVWARMNRSPAKN